MSFTLNAFLIFWLQTPGAAVVVGLDDGQTLVVENPEFSGFIEGRSREAVLVYRKEKFHGEIPVNTISRIDFSKYKKGKPFPLMVTLKNGQKLEVQSERRDFVVVKGKTDTGFVAPMAVGVVATFEHDQEGIARYRAMYRSRLGLLIELLTRHGMQLALEPAAGFYTLWMIPTQAFGTKVESAEHFNFMMIEETGVVGVHFPGYMRYAVCADIEAIAKELEDAFKKAKVSYR